LSAADKQRVEAKNKRRKVEKEVSRLKGKIKAIIEPHRGDASEELDNTDGGSNDVEDSSGEELPHHMSQHRKTPSGLLYKLRHATTRTITRRYVLRKCDKLE
jgi:hypothetical protein